MYTKFTLLFKIFAKYSLRAFLPSKMLVEAEQFSLAECKYLDDERHIKLCVNLCEK